MSPTREELGRLRTPLEPGELRVLKFFDDHLAAEWEIYVQPHLNGLRPDFVLLNPLVGIAVFEVKDWDLDAIDYRVEPGGMNAPRVLARRSPGQLFRKESPFEKAHLYRIEICDLYCPSLNHGAGLAAVTAGVIFPFAEQSRLEKIFGAAYQFRCKDERYWRLVGREPLEEGLLHEVFPSSRWRSSRIMRPEIADDLRHWLVEPDFSAEQREPPQLDARKRQLVTESTSTGYRRIRGPAGSGKTLVLAARAAELQRQGRDVLVISFNHTLLNYIRDLASRLTSDVREVTWLNFHGWCRRVMLEAGFESEYRAVWREYFDSEQDPAGASASTLENALDLRLPVAVQRALAEAGPGVVEMYDAILVDEGQDMLPEWWDVLRKVLRPGGEMLLVADTTQDVYGRSARWTDAAMAGAGFVGRWVELGGSYRMPRPLTRLARTFAERYLAPEEELLPVPAPQQELDVDVCDLRWVQVKPANLTDVCADEILRLVRASGNGGGDPVAFADLVFLCSRIEDGRRVAEKLRRRKIKILDTFAEDRRVQKRQKQTFFKGSERVKATTIFSFKGWEGRALVVGVRSANHVTARRLVYAGLTRLKDHPMGSYLTIVCADPELASFGSQWPVHDAVA
jgi:hypothetical protein